MIRRVTVDLKDGETLFARHGNPGCRRCNGTGIPVFTGKGICRCVQERVIKEKNERKPPRKLKK